MLYGERTGTPIKAQLAETSIADSYIKITSKNRTFIRMIVILIVAVVALSMVLVPVLVKLYTNIYGSPHAVIASDYSQIVLFGERYVPLVLDDAQCQIAECLVSEAQVEGVPFLGKLLFGETIYAVKNTNTHDIIYLQTEYDNLLSRYYVRENMVDIYQTIETDVPYDCFHTQHISNTGALYDQVLNDELCNMFYEAQYDISSQTCEFMSSNDETRMTVYQYQSDGPFQKEIGELICRNGAYYWFDYNDIPTDHNNSDYSMINAYAIDEKYYFDLGRLFSAIRQ